MLIVHVALLGRLFLRDCLHSVYMRDGEVGIRHHEGHCVGGVFLAFLLDVESALLLRRHR